MEDFFTELNQLYARPNGQHRRYLDQNMLIATYQTVYCSAGLLIKASALLFSVIHRVVDETRVTRLARSCKNQ